MGQHGDASKVAGALVSVLLPKQDMRRHAWTLTSRQEIHPDDFERTGELLAWLANKTGDFHRDPDGGVRLGRIRFHGERQPDPLVVRDGTVVWPS
ncbi:hypothetical protein ACFVT1_40325 [Streptomyces sp. NPDC057963]|uniref:hypothetical protein n=1 Tax=Streptomyces sp. NPDC057963 TaxID=3346290 RepID=UPI0036E4C7C3